jgi:putative transposase
MTIPLPQRKSLRLRHYDDARPGMYFVTICARDRVCLFGSIVDEAMQLNALGVLVENCWRALPAYHSDFPTGIAERVSPRHSEIS